jgi:hypothetical protein
MAHAENDTFIKIYYYILIIWLCDDMNAKERFEKFWNSENSKHSVVEGAKYRYKKGTHINFTDKHSYRDYKYTAELGRKIPSTKLHNNLTIS